MTVVLLFFNALDVVGLSWLMFLSNMTWRSWLIGYAVTSGGSHSSPSLGSSQILERRICPIR